MNLEMLVIRVEHIGILDHQVRETVSILSLEIKCLGKAIVTLIHLACVFTETFIKLCQIRYGLSH